MALSRPERPISGPSAARLVWLLDVARYGSILAVFIAYLVYVPDRMSPLRSAVLFLLALLAAWQDAVGLRRVRPWAALALAQGAAVFLLGLLDRGHGWYWILYCVLAFQCGFHLEPRAGLPLVGALYMGYVADTHLARAQAGSPRALLETALGSLWLFILASFGGRLLRDQVRDRERMQRLLQRLRESRAELEEAYRKLQEYARKAEEVSAMRERARVAREIHDTLGHTFTVLQLELEAARRLIDGDPARAAAHLGEARRLVRLGAWDVRRAVQALVPQSLEAHGLRDAVARLAADFQGATGVRVHLRLTGVEADVGQAAALVLYRCVQEALTNAYKHGQATAVRVALRCGAGYCALRVSDDGRGAEPGALRLGFGLRGIRERVDALGGRLRIRAAPGRGLVLQITVPRAGGRPHERSHPHPDRRRPAAGAPRA